MSDDERPLVERINELLGGLQTLHLATVTAEGAPQASYAPFVVSDGAWYVYLSALAPHAANLRRTGRAGVLLIRDEHDCDEPFARPRLSAECRVREEPRGSPRWGEVLDAFERRFGATAATVRELADFGLFRLEPVSGRLVGGFARARRLDGAALLALLDGAS